MVVEVPEGLCLQTKYDDEGWEYIRQQALHYLAIGLISDVELGTRATAQEVFNLYQNIFGPLNFLEIFYIVAEEKGSLSSKELNNSARGRAIVQVYSSLQDQMRLAPR